jgi:NTP pyrophosphatase (non-canonical NTP hydrolase)
MSGAIHLDDEQETAHWLVQLMWPNESPERRGLALAEEAGEVCRALLKRGHAQDGDGDRADERDWDENLRTEIGQTFVVLLAICGAEKISARDAIFGALADLDARRERLGL